MKQLLVEKRAPLAFIALYFVGCGAFAALELDTWISARAQAEEASTERLGLVTRLAHVRPPASRRPTRLMAGSETQAVAGLDEIVRSAVARSGAQIVSSRAEPVSPEDHGAIGVSARFQGDIRAAQAALFSIETGSPQVAVDQIELVPRDGDADSADPVLQVAIRVTSHWSHAP
jgi:hypothetical protein